ncbi:FMN-binding negative transcriptional regulator [Novilysobacter erysipheiresistens]|uniref:FMN-binding negative transcriptional regulator n=1 Tax=Novilysobacter erysipheiresistens TaxID=1749332 RepID=A0ABU7Z0P4_9GAMM
MYPPSAFVETDLVALDALLADDNFITLVTVRDGLPTVSHLPVLYRREGEAIELVGHFARPNPQARHAGPAIAVVHGPHAYVSPSWYPDKETEARVPTWNYAVAHLHGKLHTFDDEPSLSALVGELSDRHEAIVGGDWRFQPERDDQRVQLRGIIGFRVRVEQANLKFKLNQNHPPANRAAVADRLDALGGDRGRAIARLMRERMARPIAGD